MPRAPLDTIFPHLEALFGERITRNRDICAAHGQGEGVLACQPPDAVVFPATTDEVSRLAALCHDGALHHDTKVALIAFGAGTSLEGHVAAPHGGICVDFSHMNAILKVHGEDLDAVVQPGVTRKQLNSHLRDSGLFFPVDPGADATVGGMCATRASGTSTVRYGSMKDNVLALEVVLADGRVLKTATRARKSAAGYDLTRLMIGSEGTLGLITQATLKLHPSPEHTISAVCPFPTIEKAVDCVIAAVQMAVPMARMELLDALAMTAVNRHAKLSYAQTPTLFLEFEGSQSAVAEQVETLKSIAQDFGGTDFQWAERPEDRNRLWSARHNLYYAGLALKPGAQALTTDVCVPISNLATCIQATHEALENSPLSGLILGHVGDGNFHTMVLFDPQSAHQRDEAENLNAHIVAQALALDGTCTGEHGIGQGKAKYLAQELGDTAQEVMAALKASLDPHNILNPGKIIAPL